jgi:hypothetical protein
MTLINVDFRNNKEFPKETNHNAGVRYLQKDKDKTPHSVRSVRPWATGTLRIAGSNLSQCMSDILSCLGTALALADSPLQGIVLTKWLNN